MNNINICKTCGAEREYHENGIRRDGSTYDSFWGCPNYKDDQHQTAKAEWKKSKQPAELKSQPTDLQLIFD